MEKHASVSRSGSSTLSRRSRARGAAMVEYALILVAVTIGAGFAFKGLGKDVVRGTTEASSFVKGGGR